MRGRDDALAMSASVPDDDSARDFDGFLLKPFAMEALAGAIGRKTDDGKGSNAANAAVLDESVYSKLAGSMRRPQLEQLYALCLSDAEERLAKMRHAASRGETMCIERGARDQRELRHGGRL